MGQFGIGANKQSPIAYDKHDICAFPVCLCVFPTVSRPDEMFGVFVS